MHNYTLDLHIIQSFLYVYARTHIEHSRRCTRIFIDYRTALLIIAYTDIVVDIGRWLPMTSL